MAKIVIVIFPICYGSNVKEAMLARALHWSDTFGALVSDSTF